MIRIHSVVQGPHEDEDGRLCIVVNISRKSKMHGWLGKFDHTIYCNNFNLLYAIETYATYNTEPLEMEI